MIKYIVGKVYPFKDRTWGKVYPWLIKQVVGFDARGYAKTELMGAAFMEEVDAVEYCRWWNYKYVERKDEI